MENIWEAVAGVVALLYSIILWFSWLGMQEYGIGPVIDTTIAWLIGVVILVVGAVLIGYSGDKVKSELKIETSDIWEAIAVVVGVLLTVILWFQWLGAQTYTINTIITTAISWIVATLVLRLGSIFIGYFQTQLKATLK